MAFSFNLFAGFFKSQHGIWMNAILFIFIIFYMFFIFLMLYTTLGWLFDAFHGAFHTKKWKKKMLQEKNHYIWKMATISDIEFINVGRCWRYKERYWWRKNLKLKWQEKNELLIYGSFIKMPKECNCIWTQWDKKCVWQREYKKTN